MLKKWAKFLAYDFWNIPFDLQKPFKSHLIKWIRISVAAGHSFVQDDCYAKASALTYYSLLSIVPVLAVAFGIAKGFGFEKHLESQVVEKFLEQKEISTQVISFAYSLLESTQGGLIAGIGIIVLFWTVIRLLANIESSFNAIWKVKQDRPWSRKFSDYLAMMIFCPVFFAASSSISVYIMTAIARVSKETGIWDTISPYFQLSFQLFPFFLCWVLFTALYFFMPNTKVSYKAAICAGIIAGTSYQVTQWIYINFQIGVSSYGAIYGSFAAVPLFLVWLNVSWMITLAGAEISYYIDHDRLASIGYARGGSHHVDVSKRVLGLMITKRCVEAFNSDSTHLTLNDLSNQLGTSQNSASDILSELCEKGILVEIAKEEETIYYQPAKDTKRITIQAVCIALDASRAQEYRVAHLDEVHRWEKTLEAIDKAAAASEKNTSLLAGHSR